jgi:SET domain-containing protein
MVEARAGFPHDKVWARLGPSPIHGIGVFAIRPIPAGTNIFESDSIGLVWVAKTALAQATATAAQRAFYEDFAIDGGEHFGCPVDFNHLTPGWYLNQPAPGQDSNVDSDAALNFTARRDIAEGEELTIFYSSFNGKAPHR